MLTNRVAVMVKMQLIFLPFPLFTHSHHNTPLPPLRRVQISPTRVGFIRFLGETEFAAGFWVGVELDEPRGKNHGVVNGKKYFNCKGRPARTLEQRNWLFQKVTVLWKNYPQLPRYGWRKPWTVLDESDGGDHEEESKFIDS